MVFNLIFGLLLTDKLNNKAVVSNFYFYSFKKYDLKYTLKILYNYQKLKLLLIQNILSTN